MLELKKLLMSSFCPTITVQAPSLTSFYFFFFTVLSAFPPSSCSPHIYIYHATVAALLLQVRARCRETEINSAIRGVKFPGSVCYPAFSLVLGPNEWNMDVRSIFNIGTSKWAKALVSGKQEEKLGNIIQWLQRSSDFLKTGWGSWVWSFWATTFQQSDYKLIINK